MAKDPAILFYTSDFLTGVSDLSMEERGQYITLLCLNHQKDRLTKKSIDITVPNATTDVLAKFRKDENGLYYNERMEKEARKRAEYAEKQRQRAIKGWKKRKSKEDATASATAMPVENQDRNDIEDKKLNCKNGNSEDVAIFNKLKKVFTDFFLKSTETKYYFEGKDGKALKQLIQKISNSLEGDGRIPSKEEICKSFQYLLWKLPDWYESRLELPLINSKYNSIISEIKKNGKSNELQDYANEIKEKYTGHHTAEPAAN